jgi:hypothetical protein
MHEPAAESNKRLRPFGVYIVLILLLLTQALAFFGDVFINDFPILPPLALMEIENPQTILIINVIIALIVLWIMIGLWRLKRWAWYTTMILIGISLMWNIWRYTQERTPYLIMLIEVIAVFYMNQRSVQSAFGTD